MAAVATALPQEKNFSWGASLRGIGSAVRYQAFFVQKITFVLRKINKNCLTRAALFDSNMHQIVCRLGLRTRPHWGAYSALPAPQLYLGGLLLKGRQGVRPLP